MSRRLTLVVVWSLFAGGALIAGPTGLVDLRAPVEAAPPHAAPMSGVADPAAMAGTPGSTTAATASGGSQRISAPDAGSAVLGAILLGLVTLAAVLLVSVRRRPPADKGPGDRDQAGPRAGRLAGSSGDPLLAALRASGGSGRTTTDPRPAPRWVLHLAEAAEIRPDAPDENEDEVVNGSADDEPLGPRTGVA